MGCGCAEGTLNLHEFVFYFGGRMCINRRRI